VAEAPAPETATSRPDPSLEPEPMSDDQQHALREPAQMALAPPDGDIEQQVRYVLGAVSAMLPVGLFATDPAGRCWWVNQRLVDATGLSGREYFEVDLAQMKPAESLATAYLGAGMAAVMHVYALASDEAATGDEDRPVEGDADDIEQAPVAGIEHAPIADTEPSRGEPVLSLNVRLVRQARSDGVISGYVGIVVEDGGTIAGAETAGGDATAPSPDGVSALSPAVRPLYMHSFGPLVQTLLDSTPDIITVFNPDGSWRYSNAAASRLFGYLEDFDPASSVFGLIHPDDVETAVGWFNRVSVGQTETGEALELRVRGTSGDWRYLQNTANNLTDDPVVQGIVVSSRDITEQHHARAALLDANERLSTLVASLHIAALVEDENRVIVLTNNAFLDLFQLTGPPSKLLGKRLQDIGTELTRRFGDPTRGAEPDGVDKILRERKRHLGDRLSLPDGGELERDYVPIYVDHEYRGHLWLFRDVSDQVRAAELTAELLELERRQNRRLVEQEQVKASFLAEISHELRTPLTSILSFTELLRDGIGQDEPAEQVEFLDVITRNAERLMRLVDDLVLLDRAESGALVVDFESIDIPSLVEASVTTFAPQAEAKQLTLEMEVGEGISIAGDKQRLGQVIEVLLSNAIKFTPEGGKVSVTALQADAHWLISVADTGIGVPPGETGALFDRFYRGSNARAARIPGSGLGLSVAKAIAELHDGDVSISSKEGGGALALVALPFVSERSLQMAHRAAPEHSGA
jgi:PAS domain S-box-containing protein